LPKFEGDTSNFTSDAVDTFALYDGLNPKEIMNRLKVKDEDCGFVLRNDA
jgi:hypothetical protein